MSTEDLYARAKTILDKAMELAPGEREIFVHRACKGDDALRREVESLLEHSDAADEQTAFLDAPAPGVAHRIVEEQAAAAPPPTSIGPYRVIEPLDAGGMGEVYRCKQSGDIEREVAVKVIKSGVGAKDAVARFEGERQTLALMDHPYIARVFDAGITDEGRPYFVMEYVRGKPITEYCDQNKLDLSSRLDLFMNVCEAIHHAHMKGVIHRDIKPGNVLVTLIDGRPIPKVIDFGIAKATAKRIGPKEFFTERGQFMGTPEYMSPEQADPNWSDVDTRSDIYSLGVLLYELTTGYLPFDPGRLRDAAFNEMIRVLREDDPLKPSMRISAEAAAASAERAARRRLDTPHLAKALRGELDWIILKALEKDVTRRYESASAFARDVQRYLHDDPVEASPPSRTYRFKKFVRRNRALAIGSAAVLAVLVIGTITTSWQAIEARESAAMASRSEETMRLQRDSAMNGMLDLNERLEKALEQIEGATAARVLLLDSALEFAERLYQIDTNDPELALLYAKTLQNVADVRGGVQSGNLGDREGAVDALRQSLDVLQTLDAARSPQARRLSWSGTYNLARILERVGKLEEASQNAARALELAELIIEDGPEADLVRRTRCVTLLVIANIQKKQGELDTAIATLEDAVTWRRSRVEANPGEELAQRDLSVALIRLGDAIADSNKHARAEATPYFEEALDIRESTRKRNPTSTRTRRDVLNASYMLADHFLQLGNLRIARAFSDDCRVLAASLVESDPLDNRWRADTVRVEGIAIRIEEQGGNRSAAVLRLRDQIESYKELERLSPEDMVHARNRAKAERRLAQWLMEIDGAEQAESRTLLVSARETFERLSAQSPSDSNLKIELASTLADFADLERAAGRSADAREMTAEAMRVLPDVDLERVQTLQDRLRASAEGDA